MDKPTYYACELTPDPDLRLYHSRLPLLDGLITEAAHKGMFEDISPLMELLLAIDGVAVAQIFMYKFFIRKSPIFSWDEIDAKVLELLRGIPLACGEEEIRHVREFAKEYKQPAAQPVEQGTPGNGSLIA